jgi:hypothetical protein
MPTDLQPNSLNPFLQPGEARSPVNTRITGVKLSHPQFTENNVYCCCNACYEQNPFTQASKVLQLSNNRILPPTQYINLDIQSSEPAQVLERSVFRKIKVNELTRDNTCIYIYIYMYVYIYIYIYTHTHTHTHTHKNKI